MYIHQEVDVHTPGSRCTYIRKYMYIHQEVDVHTSGSRCTYTRKYMYIHQEVDVHTPGSRCTYTRKLTYIHLEVDVHTYNMMVYTHKFSPYKTERPCAALKLTVIANDENLGVFPSNDARMREVDHSTHKAP